MQAQLRDKERELLELRKRKLELELVATKKHIEEQEKQLNLQTASVGNLPPNITAATVDPDHILPSTMVSFFNIYQQITLCVLVKSFVIKLINHIRIGHRQYLVLSFLDIVLQSYHQQQQQLFVILV